VLRADAKTEGPRRAEGARQAKIGPWKYPRWIDVVDACRDGDGKDTGFKLRIGETAKSCNAQCRNNHNCRPAKAGDP